MNAQLIQWVALVVCILCALLRLPDVCRGRGRSVFAALVLLVVAVGLSLPAIYLPVDGLLGGVNIANLLIRLSVFAIFVLLGIRIAAAFRSRRARRLIVGPVGLAALGVTVVVTLALFLLSDLPESSTGLKAYADQNSVQLYAETGRLYPGYVAACLVIPAVKGLADPVGRAAHRVASALLALGFALVVVFALARFVVGESLGAWDVLLPFGAILLVATGLTTVWISRRHAESAVRPNLLT